MSPIHSANRPHEHSHMRPCLCSWYTAVATTMMMARHGQNFLMLPCSVVNAVSGPLGLNVLGERRVSKRPTQPKGLGNRVNDLQCSDRSRTSMKPDERNLLPLYSKFHLRLSENREIRNFAQRNLALHLGRLLYIFNQQPKAVLR
jgi:hypothetical protein